MNKNSLFKISFYLRIAKKNNKGEAPIYARIYNAGKLVDFAIRKQIEIKRWNNEAGCVTGNKEDARIINVSIATTRNRIDAIINDLASKSEIATPELVRDIYIGKNTNKEKTLLEVFAYHNQQMKERIGKDFAFGTMQRYNTSYTLTKNFIKEIYNREDIYLSDLKYDFITNYEHYLKVKRGNSHNTATKYLKNFKKIIKLAVNNEWLDKDPFLKFSSPLQPVKRDFLDTIELKAMEEKRFTNDRLELVKDIFLFACYTGLAYADVEKLSNDNISNGIEGGKQIRIQRTKTDSECYIPLLPQAEKIINKYKQHPESINKGVLLPIKSNQKMNEYLKEIAAICGISKNLTFHVARHTFATTITLTNGMSIESISSMLGHRNIRTTQHYSKIVNEKVKREMEQLALKLNPINNETREAI